MGAASCPRSGTSLSVPTPSSPAHPQGGVPVILVLVALIAIQAGFACTNGTRCDDAHPCLDDETCVDGQCGIVLSVCNTIRGECTKSCATLGDCPAGFEYCNFASSLDTDRRLCLSLEPGQTPSCSDDDDCADAVIVVAE